MTASISGVAVLAGCVRNGDDGGRDDDSGGSGDPTSGPGLDFDEDCSVHDPENIEIEEYDDGWLVVDGDLQMLFSENLDDAERAREIIQAYGFNRQCFVERPDPDMEYWLVDGEPPAAGDADVGDEDCLKFDPANLEIVETGGGWRINDGSMQMLVVETEEAAEKVLDIIEHYGFEHQCFVGRPHPPMSYFLTE